MELEFDWVLSCWGQSCWELADRLSLECHLGLGQSDRSCWELADRLSLECHLGLGQSGQSCWELADRLSFQAVHHMSVEQSEQSCWELAEHLSLLVECHYWWRLLLQGLALELDFHWHCLQGL